MIALIDADIIAYKAVSAKSKGIDWDDGEGPEIDVDLAGAKRMAADLVDAWTEGAGCTEAFLCFSDRQANFRKEVCPWYKANRANHERAPEVDMVEAWLAEKYKSSREPRLEADDLIGLSMGSDKHVAVTIDKDLQTVPGMLWNPDKDVGQSPRKVRQHEADWFWMLQTLTGDRVDGYFGAPGIGPKKAEEVLGPMRRFELTEEVWDDILDAYLAQWDNPRWNEKFMTDEPEREALINARCARILRAGDYENGEVKLWNP